MEQLVARRAHNPKVTGSSPVPATTKDTKRYPFFGVPGMGNSLVVQVHYELGSRNH